jgi:hypothetical protein
VIRVTRTQLDTGVIAVVRATEDELTIDMDLRHITRAGAAGLEQALNGIGAAPEQDDANEACQC